MIDALNAADLFALCEHDRLEERDDIELDEPEYTHFNPWAVYDP